MAKTQPWQNRIVGHGEEDPEQLLANPRNWRIHPRAQQAALEGAIADIGFIRSVTVNRVTNCVLDGHLRVALAIRNGEKTIPVEYVELTEREEAEAMATLDPIAAMAAADRDQLDALLRDVQTGDAAVQAMLVELAKDSGLDYGKTEDADAEPQIEQGDVPDALFPSDNEWGVPTLDLALQATSLDLPVVGWGSKRGGRKLNLAGGTWHFYVDDYRFDVLWADPTPVVNGHCRNVIEPNFTVTAQLPAAYALWQVYRKRWLARFWQEYGVRVIVDLNFPGNMQHLNLLGVPAGWAAFATHGYVDRLADLEAEWATGRGVAGRDDFLFVVYGGGKAVKAMCQERGWVHIIEDRDEVRAARQEREDGEE